MNEVCNVNLVGTQDQCCGMFAIYGHLGNVLHIAEIKYEPTPGIGGSNDERRCIRPTPRQPTKFTIERPVNQYRQIAVDGSRFAARSGPRSSELPTLGADR